MRAKPVEPYVCIVIPAFNEQEIIGRVIREIKAVCQSIPGTFDILVIDDGSKDRTADKAIEAGAEVITLLQNLGYGYALQTGYRVALQRKAGYLIQMDGDGQHAAESIPGILEPLLNSTADLVLGSRKLSHVYYPMPFLRNKGQEFFAFILRLLTGLKITDPTTGYQALNQRALNLYVSDDFAGDYPDTNVLLYLYLNGMRIIEVPAVFRVSESGRSMHGGVLKPLYYIYSMLLSMMIIYLRYCRKRRTP